MLTEINLPKDESPNKPKTTNGFDKHNSISFFNVKKHNSELIKFSLQPNDKVPMIKRFTGLKESKRTLIYDNCNVGLLTGYKTNITVVNVDFYKMSKDNIFLKKFYSEMRFNFGTFAVNTTNGGKHYY